MGNEKSLLDSQAEGIMRLIRGERMPYKVKVSFGEEPFYIQPTKKDEVLIDIRRREFPTPGMYYLFQEGELVYIGISHKDVYYRILQHCEEKEFDAFQVFDCIDRNTYELVLDIFELEPLLIKEFKPKLNSQHGWPIKNKKIIIPEWMKELN